MHCRRCEARSRDDATPREPAHPAPIWGAERISGLRCAHCGALLGAEDVVRLLLAKQSQLEQFGMLRPPGELPEPQAPGRALGVVRLEKD
jgi:hypothetical protein